MVVCKGATRRKIIAPFLRVRKREIYCRTKLIAKREVHTFPLPNMLFFGGFLCFKSPFQEPVFEIEVLR